MASDKRHELKGLSDEAGAGTDRESEEENENPTLRSGHPQCAACPAAADTSSDVGEPERERDAADQAESAADGDRETERALGAARPPAALRDREPAGSPHQKIE